MVPSERIELTHDLSLVTTTSLLTYQTPRLQTTAARGVLDDHQPFVHHSSYLYLVVVAFSILHWNTCIQSEILGKSGRTGAVD